MRVTRGRSGLAAALVACIGLSWGFSVDTAARALTSASTARGPACDQDDLQCWQQLAAHGRGRTPGRGNKHQGASRSCFLDPPGKQVPCSGPEGSWSAEYQCYLRLEPIPPPLPPDRVGAWY